MANEVKIVLTATDQASAVIAKAEGSLKGINTAAMNFSNVMGSMNAVMGVAQQAIQAVGKAYDATVGELMDYAKQVEDVSRYTGTSAEEASKLIQIADDLRIEVSTLKVGFRNLNNEGIQPNVTNLKKLADEYKKLPTPVDKAQFAMEKFGARSGMEMAKLLEATSEEIDEMAQSAEDLGLVLTGETIEATKAYYAELDNLNDRWMGIKIGIGQDAVPALLMLLDTFEKLQAVGEEGWLVEFAGSWWDLFMKLSYGVEPTDKAAESMRILGNHVFAAQLPVEELAPDVDVLTTAITNIGLALDPAAAYANRFKDAVLKSADAIETKMMTFLNYQLLMEQISRAQYEAGTEAVFNYTKLDILSKAYENGLVPADQYFKIASDGVVTTQELNKALPVLSGNMGTIKDRFFLASGAVKDYGDNIQIEMPPASTLIATQVSSVEGLANAWLRVPRNVTTTYTINYEGGKKLPPGVKGQHGIDMVVPPGYPGDSFPFLASSGERVTITPQGSGGSGNGGGGTIIIHNHSAGAAALTMALISQQHRSRLSRSMGG